MSACETLEGMVISGKRSNKKWTVIERLKVKPTETPGAFSVGYVVEDEDGTRGFLKASDLGMFMRNSEDVLKAFDQAITAHRFERDVLEFCHGNAMDRIVTAIDFGDIEVIFEGVRDAVFFLVFELAKGDIRGHVTRSNSLNLLWAVTTLHNLFVATSQLHAARIAHNDLKPSNALIINDEVQKIADLGRATSAQHPATHDTYLCAGDRRFAPPEQLYPANENLGKMDELYRRRVGDLWNLGSLAFYMVTGRMLTPDVILVLRPEQRPRNMAGGSLDSYQAALPHWIEAIAFRMADFIPIGLARFGPGVEEEITKIRRAVLELCNPDPLFRGHPLNRQGAQNPLALTRYVSEFDRLKSQLKIKSA